MPFRKCCNDEKGEIVEYERPNGRCPAHDFIKECQEKMSKRFKGSFLALTKMGADYVNWERFHALSGDGKPLWEFKEHDHRLFCVRKQLPNGHVKVILLNGWVKDKAGRAKEERNHIVTAQNLYAEYWREVGGKP